MCVVMVIIYKKTLEKKGADDVRSKEADLGLCQAQTMSQGTKLFSCGLMETGRWRDVGGGCAMQQKAVGSSLESLWVALPEAHQRHTHWGMEVGATSGAISSLLQDLSLTEAASASSSTTAPPSKRQCRSLSCSDELGGWRSSWRPQGSRVWTAVEKRRCHSGGSVQRGLAGGLHQADFPAMQRSSSFSLPARSNTLELPCFAQTGCPPSSSSSFVGLGPSSSLSPSSLEPQTQAFYLSHEQIFPQELPGPSPPSSPDSTPELERRVGQGGLARSRSQPCVLNHKKIGMKRRRPADTHKQRPSLDLAKMTQKLRNFHSLSCPGIMGEDCCQSSQVTPITRSSTQYQTDSHPPSHQGSALPPDTKEDGVTLSTKSCPTIEALDPDPPGHHDVTVGTTNGKEREPVWTGLCGTRRDQLGGELDIEQIERN
ncbi:protein FAM53B [Osmerus mordax]|uniref:protein FAM53B n=1 Tax=Osmerus mordax TaxID=8014 RepID=UPI0035105CE5